MSTYRYDRPYGDGYGRYIACQSPMPPPPAKTLVDAIVVPKEATFDQSMRRTAFDGYFAAVMGMSLHPGTTRDLPQHRTPEECRDIALQMLKLRDELVASGVL